MRVDAQRNIEVLLRTAMAVFAQAGVNATVRQIAEHAGVGIGTIYRHFPTRADLIAAVFRHEVDACADAAPQLVADHPPAEALLLWLLRCGAFSAATRGLGAALHGSDPAFATLPAYFDGRLRPALATLLDRAAAAGEIRRDVEPFDLLRAVAGLCAPAEHGDAVNARRMVALLVDGLRYGADDVSDTSA